MTPAAWPAGDLSIPRSRTRMSMASLGLVLSVTGCGLQGQVTHPSENNSLVGQPAPDWSGSDTEGKPIALKDYRDAPLVMNFWASWCGPCRAEEPGFVRTAHDYMPKGIRF